MPQLGKLLVRIAHHPAFGLPLEILTQHLVMVPTYDLLRTPPFPSVIDTQIRKATFPGKKGFP
jgi:hypothetical protein